MSDQASPRGAKNAPPDSSQKLHKKRKQFAQRMQDLLGSDNECQNFFAALDELSEKPRRALRLNRLKGITVEMLSSFNVAVEEKVPWESSGFFVDWAKIEKPATHPMFGAGLVYAQEPGAMEAVNFLDPKPGELVLDLCAAPGGKSTQIADRLMRQGWLVSNEPVRSRAEKLDALVARHGAPNFTVISLDPTSVEKRFGGLFDAILVDAPCSGESLFSKRNEIRGDVTDAQVIGCARRQHTILDRASQLTRPGGRIVYSTCTYSREENEDVVKAFLENNPTWSLKFEKRRWPHLDRVPGGYAALLVNEGEQDSSSEERLVRLHSEIASGAHGLIRHGVKRWDGEVDLYARAMSEETPSGPRAEIDDKTVRGYLRGEALVLAAYSELRGPVTITWRGFPVGIAQAVEGRMNNLLPKILRAI